MTDPAVATLAAPPAPEDVFGRIVHLPHALWLDSTADLDGTGSRSFIAADPFAVLSARAGRSVWITAEGARPVSAAPLAALAGALKDMRAPATAPIPFDGGAAGFLGYELSGTFERLPAPPAGTGLPDLQLAFYDVVLGWDHASGRCHVVSTGRPARGREAASRARRRLDEALAWMAGEAPPPSGPIGGEPPRDRLGGDGPGRPVSGIPWIESTASRTEYIDAVDRIIDAIRDGDVYQVNLSQRFTARTDEEPLALYRKLRRRSPAPYGAVVRAGDATILSTSPERFLTVNAEGVAETRPIKGTRPRGADPAADARLARALLASHKDRAENLMIVDLLRNDLSRVCRPGSITVPELCRLESWATVHHLVSIVRGRLRPGVGPDDLVRATFPCGSVTGAPKIRAMEIIGSHEPVARGPYCGAIGYFGFGGRIDLSVAIRILVLAGRRASFHAGGGIVYDSDPGDEYDETLAKARAIIDVLGTSNGRRGDPP